MAGGIETTARYSIVCDGCQVRAEPDVEYRTRSEALQARKRVAERDGWLLRWVATFPNLLCPDCAANEGVLPVTLT